MTKSQTPTKSQGPMPTDDVRAEPLWSLSLGHLLVIGTWTFPNHGASLMPASRQDLLALHPFQAAQWPFPVGLIARLDAEAVGAGSVDVQLRRRRVGLLQREVIEDGV